MIARLAATGVNELACLVDFGIDLPSTLASLERLAAIRRSLNSERLRPSRRNKENVHE
jgi:hypothetical protein